MKLYTFIKTLHSASYQNKRLLKCTRPCFENCLLLFFFPSSPSLNNIYRFLSHDQLVTGRSHIPNVCLCVLEADLWKECGDGGPQQS